MNMQVEAAKKPISSGLTDVKNAAELLCVSPRTVWRMIAEGQLKVVRIRRCTRLLVAELLAYQEQNGQGL